MGHNKDASDNSQDALCGPRAVCCALNQLLPRESPVKLVDVVDDFSLKYGPPPYSMRQLHEYLEESGFRCMAISPSSFSLVYSSSPLILHCNVGATSIGHFVVQLPESDRCTIFVADGFNNTQAWSSRFVSDHIDGGVLAITATPDGRTFQPVSQLTLESLLFLFGVFAIAFQLAMLRQIGKSRIRLPSSEGNAITQL